MRPMAAGVAAALISGVVMYTVGARTAPLDAFTQNPALMQTADGQYVTIARPVSYTTSPRPVVRPVALRTTPAPARPVYRSTEPAQSRVYQDPQERVVYQDPQPKRTWAKTAMIIGGSAAGGAGVGAIAGGKKGAMVGAAIGGGAASIYEATRRR